MNITRYWYRYVTPIDGGYKLGFISYFLKLEAFTQWVADILNLSTDQAFDRISIIGLNGLLGMEYQLAVSNDEMVILKLMGLTGDSIMKEDLSHKVTFP